jgi:hypothetical protein
MKPAISIVHVEGNGVAVRLTLSKLPCVPLLIKAIVIGAFETPAT